MKPRFITEGQLTALAIATISPTAVLILPTVMVMQAGHSAWLTPWLAFPISVVLVHLIVRLHAHHPGKTLIEYAPEILGKPLGLLVGVLYVLWIFHGLAGIVQQHSLFLDSTILTETPAAVLYGSLLIFSFYTLWRGAHVLIYLCHLLWPIITIALLIFILLVAPHMDPGNLAPLVSYGGTPGVLIASIGPASFLGEVVLLSFFLPYVKPGVNPTRAITKGLVITAVMLSLVLAALVAVFNADEVVRLQFPFYSLARHIFIGIFLNRLDSLFVTVWVTGAAIKLTVWLLAGTLALSQLTRLKSFKGILAPTAFFAASLSTLLYDNIAQLTSFLEEVWSLYALGIFEIGLPVLLFMAALLRNKAVTA